MSHRVRVKGGMEVMIERAKRAIETVFRFHLCFLALSGQDLRTLLNLHFLFFALIGWSL